MVAWAARKFKNLWRAAYKFKESVIRSRNMETDFKPKDLLDPTQASEYLGVHKKTLQKWARDGIVPAYKTPGGYRRYKREDLDKVLKHVEATA